MGSLASEITYLNNQLRQLHEKVGELRELTAACGLNIAGYEAAYAEGRDPFPHSEVPEYLAVLLPYLEAQAPPPATILDLGAGTGRLALPLAEAGYEVTLLEPAAAGLALAAQKAAAAGVADRLKYVCGTVADLPALPPASFDIVLGLQSLLYCADLPAALRLAAGASRGIVCFDVPSVYGFLLARMFARELTLDNLLEVLATGVSPGEETIRREKYRCYRRVDLERICAALDLQVDGITPLLYLEVLGLEAGSDETQARALEQRLREDETLGPLGSFLLVTTRVPA